MRLATADEERVMKIFAVVSKRRAAAIAKSYDFVCADDSRAAFLPSV